MNLAAAPGRDSDVRRHGLAGSEHDAGFAASDGRVEPVLAVPVARPLPTRERIRPRRKDEANRSITYDLSFEARHRLATGLRHLYEPDRTLDVEPVAIPLSNDERR